MPQVIEGNEGLEGLFSGEVDESFEKILRALMQKQDIELKTEIPNPLGLMKLKALAIYMGHKKYPKSKETIEGAIQYFMLYMVSNKREGRKEIVQAIAEGIKREQSLGEKLTQPP